MKAPRGRRGPLARAWSQARGDWWLQGVALSSLTISLAILGAYLALGLNLAAALGGLATGPALKAVLAPGVSAAQAQNLARELANDSAVAQVRYISPQEALADFRRQLGPHAGLLEGLAENPLPATLELLLRQGASQTDRVREVLATLPQVSQVLTSRPWLHRLEKVRAVAVELGAALGLLLFLGVVLLVSNTVRLAVYVRRDELEVLDLVGASASYVRAPFVLEALGQALIASLLACGLVAGLFHILGGQAALPLGLDLGQLLVFPWRVAFYLAGLAMAAALIGGLSGVGQAVRARGL